MKKTTLSSPYARFCSTLLCSIASFCFSPLSDAAVDSTKLFSPSVSQMVQYTSEDLTQCDDSKSAATIHIIANSTFNNNFSSYCPPGYIVSAIGAHSSGFLPAYLSMWWDVKCCKAKNAWHSSP